MADQVNVTISGQDAGATSTLNAVSSGMDRMAAEMDKAGIAFRKAMKASELQSFSAATGKANVAIKRMATEGERAGQVFRKAFNSAGLRDMETAARSAGAAMRKLAADENRAYAENARRTKAMAGRVRTDELTAYRMEAGRVAKANKAMNESMKGSVFASGLLGLAFRRLALGLGTYLAYGMAKQLLSEMDAWQNMRNLLRVVTNSTGELTRVQEDLYQVAQASRSGMKETAIIYARLARTSDALGLSQSKMLAITKAINQGFIVSGATAAEAHNALIQLSQGFQSGALRGDELRSVMEQASYLAMKMAEGMGVPFSQFRKLSIEGKISVKALAESLAKMGPSIQRDFDRTTSSIEQGLTKVKNAWGFLLDTLNREFTIGGRISAAMSKLADSIDRARTGKTWIEQRIAQLASYQPVDVTQGAIDEQRKRDTKQAIVDWAKTNVQYADYVKLSYEEVSAALNGLTASQLESAQIVKQEEDALESGKSKLQITLGRAALERAGVPVKSAARAEMDRLEAEGAALSYLVQMKGEELAVVGSIQARTEATSKAEKDRLNTAKQIQGLMAQISGTDATGVKFLHGLTLPENFGDFIPENFQDEIVKMTDWLAVRGEKLTEATERATEKAQELALTWQNLLMELRDIAPSESYNYFDALTPSEANLDALKQYKQLLKEMDEDWKILERRALTAAPSVGFRAPAFGAGQTIGRGRGTGLSGTILGNVGRDYSVLGMKGGATSLGDVSAAGERFRRELPKIGQGVIDATKVKPVEEFEWEWTHLGVSMRKMFIGPGGVFSGMRAGLEQFKRSLGSLSEIVANATVAALNTFRGGVRDALGDFLFGDEEREAIKDAMEYISNVDTQPLNSVVEILRNLAINQMGEGDIGTRTAEWIRGYFESALDVEDLPDSVKAKLQEMLNEVNGFLANPTEAERQPLIDRMMAQIDAMTQGSSLLDRLKHFASDMGQAVQDGLQEFVTGGLSDLLTGALVSFGEGLIEGLFGVSKTKIEAWGKSIGEAIRSLIAGLGEDVGGWFNAAIGSLTAVVKIALEWAVDKTSDIWYFVANLGIGATKAVTVTLMKAGDWGADVLKVLYATTESVAKAVYVSLIKSANWVADTSGELWAVFSAVTSTVTKTVNALLKQSGTYTAEVWSVFTAVSSTAWKVVNASVELIKAVPAEAWVILNAVNETATKTLMATWGYIENSASSAWVIAKEWGGTAWKILMSTWGYIEDSASAAWIIAKEWGGTAWKTLMATWGYIENSASEAWVLAKGWGGTAIKTLQAAWGYIENSASTAWALAKDWGGIAYKTLQATWGYIENSASSTWVIAKNWGGTAVKTLQATWGYIENSASTAWVLAKDWGGTAWKTLQAVWGYIENSASTAWILAKDWGGTARKTLSAVWSAVSNTTDSLWAIVAGWTTSATKTLMGRFTGPIINAVGTAWDIVSSWTDPVTKTLTATLNLVGDALVAGQKTISIILSKGADFIVYGATRAWAWFTGTMNAIGNALVSIGKGASFVVGYLGGAAVDIWNWLTGSSVGGGIVAILSKGASSIVSGAVDLWNWLANAAGNVFGYIYAVALKGASDIVSGAVSLWNWMTGSAVTGTIWATLSKGASFVVGNVVDAWNWVAGAGSQVIGTIWAGLSKGAAFVVGNVVDAWSWIAGAGNQVIGTIWAGLSKGASFIVGGVVDAWSWLAGVNSQVVGVIWAGLSKGTTFLVGGVVSVWDWVTGVGSKVIGTVWAALSQSTGAIWGALGNAWDWLTSRDGISKTLLVILGKGADLIGLIGSTAVSVWDWITGKTDAEANMVMALALGTDSVSAWKEGGSIWESIKSGTGDALKAAFGLATLVSAAYMAFSTGQIGTAIGSAVGGVIGAAFGSVAAGAAAGGLIGSVFDYLTNRSDVEEMKNLQMTIAQRGGLIGAVKYAGYGVVGAGNEMATQTQELYTAFRTALGHGGQTYLQDQLRAGLQIGEDPAHVIAQILTERTQDPATIHLSYLNNLEEWRDFVKGMGMLSVPLSDTVKAYGYGMGFNFAAGTVRVPGAPSTPVPAVLHGGEMVLPYRVAESIRQGGGGGSVTIHNHFIISGSGDEAIMRLFRDKVSPELDRHMARFLKDKSARGQLELHSKALTTRLR